MGIPNGFRIEFYIARKCRLVSEDIRRFSLARFERRKMISIIPVKKLREMVVSHPLARHPKKVFCPYCEKLVIPKRLHKLDFGDFALFLFTAGLGNPAFCHVFLHKEMPCLQLQPERL